MGVLTKRDIDWLIDEFRHVFATKDEFTKRFDWIAEMLDKQSGNLQSIETEVTFIRGLLDQKEPDKELLLKRVERLEKNLHLQPLAN